VVGSAPNLRALFDENSQTSGHLYIGPPIDGTGGTMKRSVSELRGESSSEVGGNTNKTSMRGLADRWNPSISMTSNELGNSMPVGHLRSSTENLAIFAHTAVSRPLTASTIPHSPDRSARSSVYSHAPDVDTYEDGGESGLGASFIKEMDNDQDDDIRLKVPSDKFCGLSLSKSMPNAILQEKVINYPKKIYILFELD